MISKGDSTSSLFESFSSRISISGASEEEDFSVLTFSSILSSDKTGFLQIKYMYIKDYVLWTGFYLLGREGLGDPCSDGGMFRPVDSLLGTRGVLNSSSKGK